MRFLIRPIRELVLAIKDARSPEMREAEDFRKLAELSRDGDGWYIAKRTIGLTLLFESFAALKAMGDILSGRATWHLSRTGESFRSFFFLGIFCVIVGAVAASREIARLRETYGGDDPPAG
jgi:hypothetical protein